MKYCFINKIAKYLSNKQLAGINSGFTYIFIDMYPSNSYDFNVHNEKI